MRLISLLCVLLLAGFSSQLLARQFDETSAPKLTGLLRGKVDYVHHDKQQLVIDDRRFVMPLNFKVSDTDGKSSNRFAIKVGQSVEYFVRYDEKTNVFYVDQLQLLN